MTYESCDSCGAPVPPELLVKCKVESASHAGTKVERQFCVLCKHYCPFHYYDCYRISESSLIEDKRPVLRKTIRKFWGKIMGNGG